MALLTAVTVREKRHAYVNEYFCRSAFTTIAADALKRGGDYSLTSTFSMPPINI